MGLLDQLMPMLQGGMMGATQQPAAGMQGTAQQQGNLAPFYDPTALAQLQSDQLAYQRKAQLAQQLMQTGYTPNSGKFGVFAGIASILGGRLAQDQNDSKLSDIVKRAIEAQSQAAQAQRMQQRQDETFKTDEDIRKDTASEAAKRQYAPLQFQASGAFDPSTGAYTPSVAAAQQEIGIKGAEADAAARATAKYREAPGAANAAAMGQIKQIMGMPDSPVKQAMLTKALGEGGMQALQTAQMFGTGGGGSGGAGGQVGSGPTGDDFLKNLSPAIANQVKAISEGRQAPPNAMAMRSPMGQQLMAAVAQYDPTFDAVNYGARAKTQNAFSAGKEAQSVNAINTALGHVAHLSDLADSLGNTDYPTANKIMNAISVGAGGAKVTNFDQARDAVVNEVTRVYRGTGGSESDIKREIENLSNASSPDQLQGALGTLTSLMGSKLGALQNQYDQGMGAGKKTLLSDDAVRALQKIQQRSGIDPGVPVPNGADVASTSAQPAPTQTATNAQGQKIGLVNGQWVPL